MEHFHLLSFFISRDEGIIVASQVAANQMQYVRAIVFVFKDLADEKDFFPMSLETTSHGSLPWKIQRISRTKRFFFSSSLLNAISRLLLSTVIKCRPHVLRKSKFSSEVNQLSISTKRHFRELMMRIWIMSRSSPFLLISYLRVSCFVVISQYWSVFLTSSKVTGMDARYSSTARCSGR